MPTSNPLKVVLDDDAANNVNELYLKFGAPPTRADYDYRFTITPGSDQEIVVPLAYAGQWYALVYGDTIRTNSAFDISAESNGVFLTGVTPDRYATDSAATLTLTGAGFDATTTFALVAPDLTVIAATSTVVDSPTRATVDFSLGGLTPGMYTVLASEPNGVSDRLVSGFTVTGAGAGQLDIQLIVPSVLGRHATATLYVDYANTGNQAIPAPLLILYSEDPNNSDRPLMTLDAARVGAGFWTSAIPAGFASSVQFLTTGASPGLLQPGEHGRVPVYFVGLQQPWDFSDRQVEFRVGVAKDDGLPVDWAAIGDSIRPDYVRPDAWQAIWSNFVSNVGGNWTGYLAALNQNAAFLGTLGASTSAITRLLGFELRQAEGLSPIRYLASATGVALPAPGPDLVFSQAFAQPISRRYELGPLGRGWAENWQLSLVKEADGTVKITDMTGTPRIFQPDSRFYLIPAVPDSLASDPVPNTTHYLAANGDHGILTSYVGGTFKLTETDGTQYYFNPVGWLDYVQDTNGNRITCTYGGPLFLLTSLTHSSGQSLTIGYNASVINRNDARITSVTDSDGRQTVYTYDASYQHLQSVQDYDGRITRYTYITGQGAAKEHALSEIAFPDGSHRYYTYDNNGRLASTYRDGGTETVSFSYDTAGTVTATDALGNPSKFYFDDWGTILKSTNPLGNSTLLSLDGNRNLSSVTDPAGRTSLFLYDARDNLARFTDAMGRATNFTYTADFNRLDKLTDANGNLTDYNYDNRGNLSNITYADGSLERWAYDSRGQSTTWTNRRGTPVGFTYDADGQITRKTYADGTHVDYVYDARGNLTRATDATGTTTLTYDAHDYLTRIDYPGPGGRWLAYTYDSGGRRATSTDQLGHQLRYQFDTAGRLSRISDETAAQVVLYEYDAVGRIALKTLGNGVYTTYDYDAAGQLLHLVNHKSDATVLSRFDYSYDSRGRRISMGTLDGAWTYSYDDIGQLTHAVFASTNVEISDQDLLYVYDAMGNRIRTVENGVTTAYTTNRLNQYTQVGDTTYAFDADGNLVSETSPSGTVLYSYDDENRLIAVQQGANAWTYTYDAFSQRVASSHNGISTRYTIDPVGFGNVTGEYDAAGSLIAGYDYGFGLLSRTTGESSVWYTFDVIGNTSSVVGPTGNVLIDYTYEPFGTILRQTGAGVNPFRFVGEWGVVHEGNDLEFMRARFYAVGEARFTQGDPIGIAGGTNLYAYAWNAPTVLVDPMGLGPDPLTKLGTDLSFGLGRSVAIKLGTKALGAALVVAGFPISGMVVTVGGIGWTIWSVIDTARKITNTVSAVQDRTNTLLNSQEWSGGGGVGSGDNSGTKGGGSYCAPSTNPADPLKTPIIPLDNGSGVIPGAVDPNQKLGPAGFGPAGYIGPSITLPYRIDFENDATATAPAQIVTITDQLDADLNWNTFALTEIAFGDYTITVPPNVQHFETSVPVTYNGRNFEVQIVAGINLATGRVFANFYSIDPATGLPPDVLTGFLPPEDQTGRGMGHVSYVINQKTGLATGTQIRNIALISFDGQPAIATNQVDPHDPAAGTDPAKEALNTIDAGAPTSAVQPLAPMRTLGDFLVSWTGADDAGGSGIGSHDIYVSTDGGSYALWKDDTTAASALYSGQAGHSYAFYSVAQDNVGNDEAAPAAPDATTRVGDGLAVTSASADASGVTVRFNRAIDPALLNLYATQTGGQGLADVTLVGATTGAVTGSVVLDADRTGFRFVKTGAPLAADTYTLTLKSAADGVIDTAAHLLDGNDDGTAGGDYIKAFNVTASGALLAIIDIARGPGQPVNQPATGSGLPVTLSNAVGANRVDFTLEYDAALLAITGVTLGSGAPAGSTLITDLSQAGRAVVTVNLGATLTSAAALELVRIQAEVPLTAAPLYTQKQVLDLTNVSINQGSMAVRDDDGVHVNAYVGDANANRGYNTLDVQRLQRVVVRFDTGFAAYPLLDPAIVGDTTGNGSFNSLDVQRLQQKVVGLPQTSIPPLPTPPLPLQVFSGADPVVHVGTVEAQAGATVVVPIEVDQIAGLESVQLTVGYPAGLLTLVAVRQVGVTADFQYRADHKAPGTITIDVSRMAPVSGSGPARLFELEFRVSKEAPVGDIPIDLQWAALNDTALTLNPAPKPGPDVTDGRIVVRKAAVVAQRAAEMAEEKFIGERREWVAAFVGNLGRAPVVNPNAGLRVTLPVAARAAPVLSLMEQP